MFSINTTQGGREELLSSWNVLKSSLAAGQSELAQYTGSGGIDARVRGLALAQEAASRWTGKLLVSPRKRRDIPHSTAENTSIAIQYISANFSLPADDVRKLGAIPDDFEDLPLP